MPIDPAAVLAGLALLAALAALAVVLRQGAALERLRLLAEQAAAGTRAEAETTRRGVTALGTDLVERLTRLGGVQEGGLAQVRAVLADEQGKLRVALTEAQQKGAEAIGTQFESTRTLLESKLRELREGNETRLAGIQKALAEQMQAAGAQAETTRGVLDTRLRELREGNESRLEAIHRALNDQLRLAQETQTREQGELRLALAEAQRKGTEAIATQFEATRGVLDAKLRELREGNETKLAEIQKTVNEQLHAAVEKQMNESFNRVIDQFAAVQKAMGDVAAVTAQIGDIKRLFSNVKTRGGWGETQVRAMLDDILPVGAYETNCKVRAGSDDAVEFAVRMPGRGEGRPLLPIDAKFPVEDYERLLAASEAGDADGERLASRKLETAVRLQAKKIAEKYINPPVTVEFAVMYLPTDALFAEVARLPGLIDAIGRDNRVLILGPSLFPALLRTIHLGFITLALEQKADQVRSLLGATVTEMRKMDGVLERLAKNAGTMTNTIEAARRRTRAVGRALRGVEAVEDATAEQLLELEAETVVEED
ncbi:MAG TPA: DNA recombination protein RmuC [Acetobacteraceae bacterium]|nr:DNA recombination protein RmuC [Acetobacteraceae bacterium]